MSKILANLFQNNLNPSEKKPTEHPLRKHYQKECLELESQLNEILDEKGKELLAKLLESDSAENCYVEQMRL